LRNSGKLAGISADCWKSQRIGRGTPTTAVGRENFDPRRFTANFRGRRANYQ
jgi:hypothetical protein